MEEKAIQTGLSGEQKTRNINMMIVMRTRPRLLLGMNEQNPAVLVIPWLCLLHLDMVLTVNSLLHLNGQGPERSPLSFPGIPCDFIVLVSFL